MRHLNGYYIGKKKITGPIMYYRYNGIWYDFSPDGESSGPDEILCGPFTIEDVLGGIHATASGEPDASEFKEACMGRLDDKLDCLLWNEREILGGFDYSFLEKIIKQLNAAIKQQKRIAELEKETERLKLWLAPKLTIKNDDNMIEPTEPPTEQIFLDQDGGETQIINITNDLRKIIFKSGGWITFHASGWQTLKKQLHLKLKPKTKRAGDCTLDELQKVYRSESGVGCSSCPRCLPPRLRCNICKIDPNTQIEIKGE